MRKLAALLLVTLAITQTAFADALVAKNSAGGHIVLTDKMCGVEGDENMRYAYSWSIHSDARLEGCWVLIENQIVVFWVQDSNTVIPTEYHIKYFRLLETI